MAKQQKVVESVTEHEEYVGQSLATKNHDVIRSWAEERKAIPATIAGTERGGRAGVLRFNFPGFEEDSLQSITWNEWFEAFDQRDLLFLYQEHLRDGNPSNFFKLINPEDAES